jgi:hypothetical protein
LCYFNKFLINSCFCCYFYPFSIILISWVTVWLFLVIDCNRIVIFSYLVNVRAVVSFDVWKIVDVGLGEEVGFVTGEMGR